MSGHCEDVCIPDTMVWALVHGSIREVRRGWQSQKSLIFMHFHGVFLGSQHAIWPKLHNGKVSLLDTIRNLIEKNLIISERRRSKEKGDEPTTYRLNIVGETPENTHTPRGVKSIPGGGVKSTPRPSDKNYTTQETVLQETDTNTDIEQPLSRRNLINLAHFLSKQPKDFDLHLVQTFNEVMHLTLYAHADPVNPFEQLEHPS